MEKGKGVLEGDDRGGTSSLLPSCPRIALTGTGVAALWDVFSLINTAHDILSRSLLLGIRLGIVLSQVINFILSSIRSERQTDASGIYNTTRQLGSFLGAAIIGIVQALGFVRFFSHTSPLPPGQVLVSIGISDTMVKQGMEWAFVEMILGWSSACLLQACSSGRRKRSCEEVKGEDEKTQETRFSRIALVWLNEKMKHGRELRFGHRYQVVLPCYTLRRVSEHQSLLKV